MIKVGVHPVAESGFGAGTNELYDRARPSYPSPAISAIHQALASAGIQAQFNVVEMGSGTGIFTRSLLQHPDFAQAISHLIAIEPSKGMRSVFSASVHDDRVTVQDGTFQSTDIPDGAAHLLIVAQAWHWCPDFEAGMKEISRILKPNGVAAFIWNLEDNQVAPWVKQIRDAYEQHENGTPQFRLGLWRAMFRTETYMTQFHPAIESTYQHWVPTTVEQVIDRVHSKSYITQLSAEDRKELDVEIHRVLTPKDDKIWINQSAGVFQYPYRTTLVTMQKSEQ